MARAAVMAGVRSRRAPVPAEGHWGVESGLRAVIPQSTDEFAWMHYDGPGEELDGLRLEQDGALAEVLALAREPLDVEEEPTVEIEVTHVPPNTVEVDALTAAALESLNAAHERTVAGVGDLVAVTRASESQHALTAAAIEALGRVGSREIPAPVVNVDVHTPEVRSAEVKVDVHTPEQPTPHVEVTMPEIRMPEINVNVEPARPRAVRVELDENGNRRYVPEDEPV